MATRTRTDNGLLWTLGAMGLIAGAGVLSRRGSFAVPAGASSLQRGLVLLSESHLDPEVVIRTQDVVLSAIKGQDSGPCGSMHVSNETLIEDARSIGDPNADLATYLEIQNGHILNNNHPLWRFDLLAPTKYDKLIPWVGKIMHETIRQARRNVLPAQNEGTLSSYGDAQDHDRTLTRAERIVLQWQDFYAKTLPDIADWYECQDCESKRTRQPAVNIMSLSWNQALEKSGQWR